MKFLRENWLWIVIPIVLVTIAGYFVLQALSGEPDTEFTYPL